MANFSKYADKIHEHAAIFRKMQNAKCKMQNAKCKMQNAKINVQ